jgi:hypothetical protein
MRRHSPIQLIWVVVLTLVMVNGWFAVALLAPAQAHAACARECAQTNAAPALQNPPPTNTPTLIPSTTTSTTTQPIQSSNGQPCLQVAADGMISSCEPSGSVALTVTSLSQVTISGQNWTPGQGTLTICPASVDGTCTHNQQTTQLLPIVGPKETFTQNISNLSFASYTFSFSDTQNHTNQHVGLTVTFSQGVAVALDVALGAALLSLLVFFVGGGLRVAARKPVGQGFQS